MRILLTGSRYWQDIGLINMGLSLAWYKLGVDPKTILVHGACHLGGADTIAARIWEGWGLPVEPHPAKRDSQGRLLGPQRNQEMVNLGADLCLAFPLDNSRGTFDCMRRATRAGIPVYTPKTLHLLSGKQQ